MAGSRIYNMDYAAAYFLNCVLPRLEDYLILNCVEQ